jgi:hypothetical protein
MPITNEDLFQMHVITGRRLVQISQLLQKALQLEVVAGKKLAEKLPDMPGEQRQAIKDKYSALESQFEQWEADDQKYSNVVESFAKLK